MSIIQKKIVDLLLKADKLAIRDKTQFKTAKDYIGANVTYLRSPSSADIWHAENQYLNIVAIEGFVHSKDNGRVSHLTHYF
jgi:hypothetical protein